MHETYLLGCFGITISIEILNWLDKYDLRVLHSMNAVNIVPDK